MTRASLAEEAGWAVGVVVAVALVTLLAPIWVPFSVLDRLRRGW